MRARRWIQPASLVLAALLSFLALAATSEVSQAQTPQGATLTVLRGTVAVVFANGSAVQPAGSGLTLGVGDRVATVGSATALVTFFEGSELELGPDATIILREIEANGSEVHVSVEDVLGTAVGRVQAFASPNSTYRMQNPGGQTVALIRGSTARMTVFDSGGVLVAVSECSHICVIEHEGKVLFQDTGDASFGITSTGTVTQGSQESSLQQQDPDQSNNDGGSGNGGESSDDSGGGDDPGYGLRESTPLSSEWERLRSRDDLNPLSAGGSLLALGMIGLGVAGSRRRH